MARKATGSIVEHVTQDGRVTRALRFSAYGKRRFVKLGAVTPQEAAKKLEHVLADVERGLWQSERQPLDEVVKEVPTFHAYCLKWWPRNTAELAPRTLDDYKWRLSHLLPAFQDYRLDKIEIDTVEDYMTAKRDAGLSPRSVNMTLTLLAAILESAVERGVIDRNPAKGKGRRVKSKRTKGSCLTNADQIQALLDAATELDRVAVEPHCHVQRRAIVATLVYTGLRISELCALKWRDVDLANGRLTVRKSKTEAGERSVKIRGALRDELSVIRPAEASGDAYVFPTRGGGQQTTHNLRARVVNKAAEKARETMTSEGGTFPEKITPHSLRRTFATVLFALGEPHPDVMAEMGHVDASLTLSVYAQAMALSDDEKRALRNLVESAQLADQLADETRFGASPLAA